MYQRIPDSTTPWPVTQMDAMNIDTFDSSMPSTSAPQMLPTEASAIRRRGPKTRRSGDIDILLKTMAPDLPTANNENPPLPWLLLCSYLPYPIYSCWHFNKKWLVDLITWAELYQSSTTHPTRLLTQAPGKHTPFRSRPPLFTAPAPVRTLTPPYICICLCITYTKKHVNVCMHVCMYACMYMTSGV